MQNIKDLHNYHKNKIKELKPKKKCITEFDMFGHIINLNFNKNGSEFKTPIGGAFSIVIKIVIWIYVGLKLYNMITLGDNQNTTQYALTNYTDQRHIKYVDMDFTVFYAIKK